MGEIPAGDRSTGLSVVVGSGYIGVHDTVLSTTMHLGILLKLKLFTNQNTEKEQEVGLEGDNAFPVLLIAQKMISGRKTLLR